MTDDIKNEHSASNTNALITILCMLGILTLLGSSFVFAEKKEGIKKKPRFELFAGTLVDNKTRLMWPLNGHLAEQTVSWHDAFDFIAGLNREAYEGHKNWRLPSREELKTLVEHVKEQGFGNDRVGTVAAGLHALGMTGIKDDEYWTSTEHLYNSGEAWFVNMKNGGFGTGTKTLYFSLLPVRSLP